jgi:hypothetical protein
MIKKNVILTIALIGLLGATIAPTAAIATTASDMHVIINGTPAVDPTYYENAGKTKSWINVAGSYTFGTPPNTYTITIAPKCTTGAAPDNLARVEAGDDSADDVLFLKNAKITISSIPNPAPEHLISFWATFNSPPSTDRNHTPLPIRMAYKLDGSNDGNSFTRGFGGATGNSVRARGSIEFPKDSNTWWPIESSTFIELNTANFSAAVKNFFHGPWLIEKNWDATSSPNDLNGPRVLKGDFWFKFTNTSDILSIPRTCATPGHVLIKSVPAFIPREPEEPGRHK